MGIALLVQAALAKKGLDRPMDLTAKGPTSQDPLLHNKVEKKIANKKKIDQPEAVPKNVPPVQPSYNQVIQRGRHQDNCLTYSYSSPSSPAIQERDAAALVWEQHFLKTLKA